MSRPVSGVFQPVGGEKRPPMRSADQIEERRGLKRALHAAEAQALAWHKLAEALGSVLLLVLDRPGVRELVPDGLQARAAKLLMRAERADGAEVDAPAMHEETAWASFGGLKPRFRDKLAEAVRRGHLVLADRDWLDGVECDLAELWGLGPEQLDQALVLGRIAVWADSRDISDGGLLHFKLRTDGVAP